MTHHSSPHTPAGGARLILASASPRRREILARLGIPFRVEVSAFDETSQPGEPPLTAARRVAWGKAVAVGVAANSIVIAADTIVVFDGRILGKPKDANEARRMLERLRARRHEVITGLCLVAEEQAYLSATTTHVWMRDYSDQEIADYIARGEPFDKAGGYAIQDTDFHPVKRIEGCYLNVVGLPLCEVRRGLHLIAPDLMPTAPASDAACPDCQDMAAGLPSIIGPHATRSNDPPKRHRTRRRG